MVIFQAPNKSLIAFAIGWLGLRLFPSGIWHWLALALYAIAGIIWAIQEIWSGANWFRRLLGILALTFIVATLVSQRFN